MQYGSIFTTMIRDYCINLNFDFFFYLQIYKKKRKRVHFVRKTGVCKRSSLSADTIGILPDL